MKTLTSGMAAAFMLTSSLFAVPLTWKFSGIGSSASQFDGASIAGLGFELRILLDTTMVGVPGGPGADVSFPGPHQGEVEIQTLGLKPLDSFNRVEYFAPGGLVTAVQFYQPAFSDIGFPVVISSDSLHLTPINPIAPLSTNNTLQSGVFGPNGLFLSGVVQTFSAVITGQPPQPVPETASTAGLLVGALLVLSLIRRRVQPLI